MFENFYEFILFIFIFIIVLFFYLHIHHQFKVSNDLEIYEIDQELSKEKLEEICNLRQPIVMDVTEELSLLVDIFNTDFLLKEYSSYEIKLRNKNNIKTDDDVFIPLQICIADELFKGNEDFYYSENNNDFLNESGLIKNIIKNDYILKPALSCNNNYDILFGCKNATTPLRYEINYRNYLLSTGNNLKIRLMPPKYINFSTVHADYDDKLEHRIDLNIWDTNLQHINKIKYLEIDLTIGKILYIPPYWAYSIKFESNQSSGLFLKYKNYMNIVAISPILLNKFMQEQNTKLNYYQLKKNKTNELINCVDLDQTQQHQQTQQDNEAITIEITPIDSINNIDE